MTSDIGMAGEKYPDALVSMAFALQRNPGAYAVLLGAGISASSGIPTAWDVENELIRQIALIEGESPENPMKWYEQRFERASNYDDLLSRLASTKSERQALLENFFVRSPKDDESAPITPTVAHRALARLMESGRVKIVLTTNFDHLMEKALRDIGIEPVIVNQVSDLNGLKSLHMQGHLIVHLHGDYLTPVDFLNTTEELSKYPPEIDRLLDRIFGEYGLVIAGWSARWDTALRTALARNANRLYARYWIDHAPLHEEGIQLLAKCEGIFVEASADEALVRVAAACDAIALANARGPFSVGSAVATAKKALEKNDVPISLHDLIAAELRTLRECPVLMDPDLNTADVIQTYTQRLTLLETALSVPVSLIATTAYWGNDQTDRWWLEEISRFAAKPRASGQTALIELLRIPAVAFLYAAGISAVSSGRYDLVRRLLVEPTTYDDSRKKVRVSSEVTHSKVLHDSRPGKHLFDYLQPTFVEQIGIGYQTFRDAWERFEFLRLLQNAYLNISEKGQLAKLLENRRALDTVLQQERTMPAEQATQARWIEIHTEVKKNYKSVLNSYMNEVQAYTAQLRIDGYLDSYHLIVAQQVKREVERDGQASPLIIGGLCGQDAEALLAVLDVVDYVLEIWAHQVARSAFTSGYGVPQTPFWLDEPRDHED